MPYQKPYPVNFARHSHQGRAETTSTQRLINMYAERTPPDDKTQTNLIGTPGLTLFATVGTGPIFGMHKLGNLVYVVSNNEVYTLNSAGTSVLLGTIGSVSSKVSMSNNFTQVVIVIPGSAGYIATSSTLTQIIDGDFPTPDTVTTLDDFTIVNKNASGQFFSSDQSDASSWAALNFATAEGESDDLVAVFTLRKELWLFGEDTTEVWYNSGVGTFPFKPIQGAFIQRGCAARLSIAKDDNTLFWLGDDKIFYKAAGYAPQRISTHAIEEQIRQFTTISDATSFVYTEDGHKFICWAFPTEKRNFVYDVATQMWHERGSFEKTQWKAATFVKAFSKNLVGDFENGKIYELDLDKFTDDGLTIQRTMISPVLYSNTMRGIHDRFRLDMEPGIGLITGQGSDPQAMLQFSDDGGKTFSNEKWETIGKIGEYENQLVWRALGLARSRVYKVVVSDPVKVNVSGAYIDVRIGKP